MECLKCWVKFFLAQVRFVIAFFSTSVIPRLMEAERKMLINALTIMSLSKVKIDI